MKQAVKELGFNFNVVLAHDAWYTLLAKGRKWNGNDPFAQ
jgi:hypothetical protein